MGRESHARTLMPSFTVVTLKMWAYSPQIAKIGTFTGRPARSAAILVVLLLSGQITHLSGRKCGNAAPKTIKISNFSHKFARADSMLAYGHRQRAGLRPGWLCGPADIGTGQSTGRTARQGETLMWRHKNK